MLETINIIFQRIIFQSIFNNIEKFIFFLILHICFFEIVFFNILLNHFVNILILI